MHHQQMTVEGLYPAEVQIGVSNDLSSGQHRIYTALACSAGALNGAAADSKQYA